MGVKDIFDVHARAFYREIALLEGDNPGRLRLGYIKLDDHVLATFSGTICHDRLLIVLCSLADGDWQRQSPGALLVRRQIKQVCADGLALYDFAPVPARIRDNGPTWSCPCSTASLPSSRRVSP